MRFPSPVTAALLALLLAGCSGLQSRDEPTVSYVLRPPTLEALPVAPIAPPLAAMSLKVLRVVAQPGYAGDRILLLGDDRSLGFFAASRWVDVLPAVVGSLAVESLRGTAALRAVYDENAPFGADYTLRLTIRRFDAEYAAKERPPHVTVSFECTIGRRSDRATVASFVVEARADAGDDRMREVVGAFEQATQAAFTDAVRRTLELLSTDAAVAGAQEGRRG